MKIVMLDKKTLGDDCDLSELQKMGDFIAYDETDKNHTIERIKDADAVFTNKVVIGKDEIDNASNLKYIGIMATRTNNIDLEYARKRGITVTNVRNYSTPAVAQHTFAMALYILEKISYYDDFVKSGAYSNQLGFSNFDEKFFELEGKTWGIAGMGNIGRKVAGIAEAFGCRVIFYSASGQNTSTEYEQVELDALLTQSDILSLHCPLTERTRNLINRETLAKMKSSAILINVARGPVVNDADLCEALEKGVIAGAGLDVLGKEPMEKDNPLSRIKDSRKLLITPHMAWASVEARTRCLWEVYKNIEAFAAGKIRNCVDI